MGGAGYFIDAETVARIVAVGALVGFTDYALCDHHQHGHAAVHDLLPRHRLNRRPGPPPDRAHSSRCVDEEAMVNGLAAGEFGMPLDRCDGRSRYPRLCAAAKRALALRPVFYFAATPYLTDHVPAKAVLLGRDVAGCRTAPGLRARLRTDLGLAKRQRCIAAGLNFFSRALADAGIVIPTYVTAVPSTSREDSSTARPSRSRRAGLRSRLPPAR